MFTFSFFPLFSDNLSSFPLFFPSYLSLFLGVSSFPRVSTSSWVRIFCLVRLPYFVSRETILRLFRCFAFLSLPLFVSCVEKRPLLCISKVERGSRSTWLLNTRRRFPAHCGLEQPRILTEVLGHSLVRSLVRSYRSIVCLLRTTHFARALRCAHLFARSLTLLTPELVGQ